MTVTRFAVINQSTMMSDDDAKTAWYAVKNQLYWEAAPLLNRKFVDSVFVPKGAVAPADAFPIVILDNPDQAGALGYHTEDPGGKVWGRVFVQPVISNGGTMLSGSLSVSAVLSHEVLETFVDMNANRWADRLDGTMVALEVADPVENDAYEVGSLDAAGSHVKVSVSNFVLDAWFDPMAAMTERFDFMQRVKAPLTMSPNGYVVVLDTKTGTTSQVFGSEEAEWFHMMKKPAHPASRLARRMGAHGMH